MSRENAKQRQARQAKIRENAGKFQFQRGHGGGQGNSARRSDSANTASTIPSIPPIQPGARPRGPMFMDPVSPSQEMPSASSFMDPVAPKDADVTQLATKPGRQILPKEETVVNKAGVVQTGKNLSGGAASDFSASGGVDVAFVPEYANSSFNDLLAAQGNQRYTPYSSNQLPTTVDNPFEGTAPKTDGFNSPAPGISGAQYDNYGASGGAAAASSTDKSEFTPMSGQESRIEGASERPKSNRLADALADTAGINSYMSKFSSGDRERAAGMAFLNADDSLKGLQARDAVNDMVYAGGQHYGRDGDGTFKVDRADARDVASGKNTAAGLLESYKSRITASQKDTPAVSQDPVVSTPDSAMSARDAVKSAFGAGAQTDFELNNQQATPQSGVGPVVPTDQIPKDLSGEAGKKYLADLDAGRLFK